MSNERIVIVAYRPHSGKDSALVELCKKHFVILKEENLISDRTPIIMQAKRGVVVEVFGWKSAEAIEAAHQNQRVKELWEEYASICDYIPISEVAEANQLFSEFSAIN